MKTAKKAALVVAAAGLAAGASAGSASALDGGSYASGAYASGAAKGSPGALSGNVVQVPIHIPVNLCGNTVNIIGLLNPAMGNVCVNH